MKNYKTNTFFHWIHLPMLQIQIFCFARKNRKWNTFWKAGYLLRTCHEFFCVKMQLPKRRKKKGKMRFLKS